VAQILADSGVTDVHYIQDGFDAWRQAGYPLDPK
jgi:rhodanese-related sulfurtransferase